MSVVIIWLILMIAGLAMTLWLLWDVLVDRRVLIHAGITNGRRIIVNGDIRSAWVKVAAFAIFVLVGLDALLTRLELVPIAWAQFNRWGLLVGAGFLVWDAIMGRRVRQVMLSKKEGE